MNVQSPENIWKELWNYSEINFEYVSLFWSKIQKAYNSKERFYHNLEHISLMLNSSQIYKNNIADLQNMKLAIFYHDIVYSARKKDNEERSAKLAYDHLKKLQFPVESIDKCCNFILATKMHHNNTGDKDLNYFLDFDLEKLGAIWSEYENYKNQIRLEYRIFPDVIYKPGRVKVLEYLLNLDRIYKTDVFFDLYENKARNNLIREMNLLKH